MIARNDNNNKKRLVALAGVAAIILLIASIVVIGVAQPSYQQLVIRRGFITSWMIEDNSIVSGDLKDGAAVRSSDVVDGQVNSADLANNAVTSEKIRDGQVKAEDLDPSMVLGGGSSGFSLQVTERSNHKTVIDDEGGVHTITVQCNTDEITSGGGFTIDTSQGVSNAWTVFESKKQGNGWTATFFVVGTDIAVYAECLRLVPANTAATE